LPDGTRAVIPDDLPRGERVKAAAEVRRLWRDAAGAAGGDTFQPQGLAQKAGQFGLGVADTMALGFGDEGTAAALSLPALIDAKRDFGSEYEGNLADMRRRQTGGYYHAGQIVGGVMPGAVAGRVVNPAMRLGELGMAKIANVVGPGGIGSVVGNAALGAGLGGVYGYGSGEGGAVGRADDAVVGGGLGGLMGGVAGGALALAQRHTGVGGPPHAVGRALERDGVNPDPQSVSDLFSQLPPEQRTVATLMDVGGENTRGLGRAVANMPGPAKERMLPALEERQADAAARMVRSIGRVADEVGAPAVDVAALQQQRKAAAGPLYQALDAIDVPVSPEMAGLLGRPAAAAALKRAVVDAANDGVAVPQAVADAIAAGQLEGVAIPVRVLDYAKQHLADLAGEAQRAGRANETRRFTSLADELRGGLIEATGGDAGPYAKALEAWAGPSQVMEAYDAGRRYAATGKPPQGASRSLAAAMGPGAPAEAAQRLAAGEPAGLREAVGKAYEFSRQEAAQGWVWRDPQTGAFHAGRAVPRGAEGVGRVLAGPHGPELFPATPGAAMDVLAQSLATGGAPADTSFAAGVRSGVEDVLAGAPTGADVSKRVGGSPAKRVVLDKALGEQGGIMAAPSIAGERAFARTYADVTRGSRTAPMLAEIGDVAPAPPAGFSDAIMRLGRALLNKASMPGEKGRAAIAEVLSEMEPGRRDALIRALLDKRNTATPLPRAGYAPAVIGTNLLSYQE
jgi:hypothetical protein